MSSLRSLANGFAKRIKQMFCFHHVGPFNLKHRTGNHKYDTYGGPMDEYETTCNKCGKKMLYWF